MAFVSISDEYGKIEAIIFPKVYEKYIDLSNGDIIKISGKVEKRYDEYQLVINALEILK